MQGNLDYGIKETFACGIRNLGKFARAIQNPVLWNPEFSSKKPKKDWNPETKFLWQRTWNPESTAWNPESRTVLAIIRSFEGVNGNARRPFTFHCKLYFMDFRISNILRIFCFTAVCCLMHFVFYRYNVKQSSMKSIGNLKIVLSIHKVFPFSISVNFPGYFWLRSGSKKIAARSCQ